jgi:hypothetical protein
MATCTDDERALIEAVLKQDKATEEELRRKIALSRMPEDLFAQCVDARVEWIRAARRYEALEIHFSRAGLTRPERNPDGGWFPTILDQIHEAALRKVDV